MDMSLTVVNILEEGRFGGPQRRVLEVSSRLQNRGIQTIVLLPNGSKKFVESLKEVGVPYKELPLHRLTKDLLHLLKYFFLFPFEIFLICKEINRVNADIIHVNGAFQIKGVIAGKLLGKKVLWHLNDTYMPEIIMVLFRLTKRWANHFIVASQKTYQLYLTSEGKRFLGVVSAPVDTKKFKKIPHQKGEERKITRILTVANINPVKGIELIIRTAIEIRNVAKEEVQFLVAGKILENQKAYFSKLQSMINENELTNVHFLGERANIQELLNEVDFYFCSSRYEASPMSVWEALATSLPVVSTNVGDIPEIFKEQHCGVAVPMEDPKRMAQEFIRLMNNPKMAKDLANNGRRYVEENLDIERCVDNHQRVYRKIVGEE